MTEYHLAMKRSEVLIHATVEKPNQYATCWMMPFIRNSQARQILSNQKADEWLVGRGWGKGG